MNMERLLALYNTASPSGREKSIARLIKSELDRMGVRHTQDRTGNIYAVKGRAETYPCVVAHMDEVHDRRTGSYSAHIVAGSIIVGYDHRKRRVTGIGADDKNGVWMCLECLRDFKEMKCAFFVQEETGCHGSGAADMDFFADCRFVIGCDRKGNSDMVTAINGTALCSRDFITKAQLRRHGYKTARGLLTDVYALKRKGLGVSCVNLSCGYYEPHTDHEYTVIADLLKCRSLVKHIILTHKDVSRHKNKEHGWLSSKSLDGFYDCNGYGWLYPHLLERRKYGTKILESTKNSNKTEHDWRTEK